MDFFLNVLEFKYTVWIDGQWKDFLQNCLMNSNF